MPTEYYALGVMCISYFVSRAALAALRGWDGRTLTKLIVAHVASLLVIAAVVVYLRSFNPMAPMGYAFAQIFWFLLDWARTWRPRSHTGRKNPLRVRHFEKGLAIAMVALALLYLGHTVAAFEAETNAYAAIPIGGKPAEALYASGKPDFVRDDPTKPFSAKGDPLTSHEWLFASPQMLARFDRGSDELRSILCSGPRRPSQASCAPTLLLSVGNAEWDVVDRLGAPTTTELQGGIKLMRYPEIGHDFVLERYAVTAIRAYRQDDDKLRKLWRLIRYALP